MIPGMNSRQMRQMMKQMGIQQQELPARRVEIFLEDRKLVIEPCDVAAVNMMGQQTWQVTGEAQEESLGSGPAIPDEDIQTVAAQAGVTQAEARAALEAVDGDLAAAIIHLQNNNDS